MTTASNLYAEKIFAEHPSLLWALDDQADFVSLFSSSNKQLGGFSVTGGTAPTLSASTFTKPMANSPIVKIDGNGTATQIVLSSTSAITRFQDLDSTKNSFVISTYFYSGSSSIVSVDIGYQKNSDTPVFQTFNISADNVWTFLSATFDISSHLSGTGNIKVIFRINLSSGSLSSFYFNGLSFGQWAEQFTGTTSGVIPQTLSDKFFAGNIKAVPAKAYGGVDSDAYYLASGSSLYAFNDGFPMVYGASSITRILPNPNLPSLVIPGNGFLNELGRYKESTVEFWLKIANGTSAPFKIFGPIRSTDGLYVDNGNLVLKVNDSIGSFFLDEFDRPMLVHISYGKNFARVLINGEEVIYISIDNSSIILPSEKEEESPYLENDWLGFYANSEIQYLELDAVAIYPYMIPNVVAKRRFVYGQGVDYPSSSSVYGVSSAVIDYSVSEYSNNFLFPDMTKWNAGIIKNSEVSEGTISTPKYTLPEIVLDSETYPDWIESCKINSSASSKKWISFTNGHIFYDSINVLLGREKVKKIFGYFEKTDSGNQTLFELKNQNNDLLTVSLIDTGIQYSYTTGSNTTIIATNAQTIDVGDKFVAGIDISLFTKTYGTAMSKFFGKVKSLSMYVARSSNLSKQFTGKIYGISFGTDYQYTEKSGEFGMIFDGNLSENNIVPQTSYMLYPLEYLGEFVLDIYVKSLWQDFVPLSYFAKTINYGTNSIYTLDFLQINLDIPTIDDLSIEPSQKRMAGGRAFASIQYLATGANSRIDTLTTVAANQANVIVPDSTWSQTKKYEIYDNALVYLPKGIDFKKMAIVLYVEMESPMAISKPVRMRSLQIASQSINKNQETKINTKFGIKLSPYIIRGIYNDFNAVNPISIYKGSTPYMYLTKKSGIQIRGGISDTTSQRGIKVEVNQERSGLYRVGAVQTLTRFADAKMPVKPTEVFYIKTLDKTISFYIESANSERTRGRLFAINRKTGLSEPGLTFFLNGKIVKDVLIKTSEWNMLGVQFINSLNFDSYQGYIGVTGPMIFNNMSNYKHTSAENASSLALRTWNQLSTVVDGDTSWQELLEQKTWENVLYIPTTRKYLIDPGQIFNSFVGVDKLIVSDTNVLTFKNYAYRAYKGIEWESKVVSAI